jgi:hypothetical protein
MIIVLSEMTYPAAPEVRMRSVAPAVEQFCQTGPLVTDQRVRQGIDSRQLRGQFGVQAMTGGDRGW